MQASMFTMYSTRRKYGRALQRNRLRLTQEEEAVLYIVYAQVFPKRQWFSPTLLLRPREGFAIPTALRHRVLDVATLVLVIHFHSRLPRPPTVGSP